MGASHGLDSKAAMASRWRRRTMCVLIADGPAPAALREVTAQGAFVETNARPPLGASVELHHPEAGAIAAEVRAIALDGIALAFPRSDRSVAFALAAIAADMSRPPSK
jgi:hypothetical protein